MLAVGQQDGKLSIIIVILEKELHSDNQSNLLNTFMMKANCELSLIKLFQLNINRSRFGTVLQLMYVRNKFFQSFMFRPHGCSYHTV